MDDDVLPDAGSDFGRRVRARLRDDQIAWFTTVGSDGTPQPNPVWFLWDGAATLLVYNRAEAHRLVHIARRPQVAMHLDGDGHGGDIVVMLGSAELAHDVPAPYEHADYLAKYSDGMAMVSGSAERFSTDYPVAVTVRIERVRGH